MTKSTEAKRAIGIARQSHGDGESVAQQTARIEDACTRDGLELIAIHEEQDVSGRTPLDKRRGLRAAIEAVEAGDADVVIGAYFDRLMRSLAVQHELVERVEAAGGRVLALDTGQLTNGSAGQWLSGTMLGAVAEYHARTTAERTHEAQIRAVNRGVWMSPYVPTGYDRGPDGKLVPNTHAATVVRAYALRADGQSVADVFKQVRGLELTYASVGRMLKSRAYRGEVHFGDLVNRSAHTAIVDADTWQRAQRAKASPGRRAKSDRLLARLGVLRCGSCGGRMSATTGRNGARPIYRCGGHVGDQCAQRMTIGAEAAEEKVWARTQEMLADVKGRAAAAARAIAAKREADKAEKRHGRATRLAMTGDADESEAAATLAELRAEADAKRAKADRLADATSGEVVDPYDPRIRFETRRRLIRSTVIATVRPAASGLRGADRVDVKPLGQ